MAHEIETSDQEKLKKKKKKKKKMKKTKPPSPTLLTQVTYGRTTPKAT
jgi:hypothetical protein